MKHSQLTSWSILNLKQIYKLYFITNWPKEEITNENDISIKQKRVSNWYHNSPPR